MRPPNQTARDLLPALLARRGRVAAADLAGQLGVSVATLHRLLQAHPRQIISRGAARRARYAWRRPLRGQTAPLPLIEVDASGRSHTAAQLDLLQPQGSGLDLGGSSWPVPDEARDGWWDGLPYVLQDMRPQGYLGRQLARAQHHSLGVSDNPQAWSDDDVAHVLSHIGSDCSGNLILGAAAFERWQALRLAPPEPVAQAQCGAHFAQLAQRAVAAGVPGSSAAGEFPKFPALRHLPGSGTPHVLVKFSGAEASAAVQRWSDLLVCERLALQCLGAVPGCASAACRIVQHSGRTFLELERFDRHGLWGRSPLVSLATLDAAFVGQGQGDWARLAAGLHPLGLIDEAMQAQIEWLGWFGRLIANTDMHAGNLSFRPQPLGGADHRPRQPGPLALAPAYDMLPMAYAPLAGGEVAPRNFEPALPQPHQRGVWLQAGEMAQQFWARAATDSRISDGFRRVCRDNARTLLRLLDQV
ncbi:MAG: type II toxin-antitoxin system HipA family toxin YjjJ [Ideonella sp.]|nr:type II toxin-antitoxin system HipA family toxin YjjJ [Ideonella sp.]